MRTLLSRRCPRPWGRVILRRVFDAPHAASRPHLVLKNRNRDARNGNAE